MLKRYSSALVFSIAGFCMAGPSVTYIKPGYLAGSLSYDGTAAAGNVVSDGSYETFRWTSSDGAARLGMASYPVISRASGTPDISFNGKRVSASIVSSDFQLTQGLWDVVSGWTELMPPEAPGGALVDDGYGSAWGLSGNGECVTGFFWSASYRAQASIWSSSNGVTALGQIDGRSARANATSYDGGVCGGWEENEWGSWMPRAWRNGTKYELHNEDGGVNQVEAVNADGSVLGGSSRDNEVAYNVATLWYWNGASYDTVQLGALIDAYPEQTTAAIMGVSADGSIAVGVHMAFWGSTTGIVWTASTGLIPATDYFALIGAPIPATYAVLDCSAISADGSAIAATLMDTTTFQTRTAIVRSRAVCPGDLNNDGQVDDADFVSFAAQYDVLDCADSAMPGYCRGDMNNDGFVDDADFVLFAQAYDQLVCP
ncbi:MAG: hypothetical protein J0L78_00440 [Planctomycetes bacterium]|nr:hypothetical protein [Planctomycetota bacterium]